jgi:hypothetical protein
VNTTDRTSTQGEPFVADEQALARYRYLLRTAPPEAIEQAHAEAFSQLTPGQRAQALRELSRELPSSERTADTRADAQTLARVATRAELRQPGTLERSFGRGGVGPGGMLAGGLLSSIAGGFIGTAIAHHFLGGFDGSPEAAGDGSDDAAAEASYEESDIDTDEAGDDFGDFSDV